MPRLGGNDSGSPWLSLGPAARLLGVSEVTLRHWADAGQVRSYRTVGAHRRFAREDLLLLLREHGRTGAPADLEDQALQRLRRRLRSPRLIRPPLESLDEEARGHLRVLGRRLVELALRYHNEHRRRPVLREEARFIGQEYGVETHRLGLSLTEALASFLSHRSALIDAVRSLAPEGASRDETLDLWRDVAELTDAVLLALTGAYDQEQEGSRLTGQGTPHSGQAALP